MKTTIEFSTDGGKTWKHCDELRVCIADCAVDEDDKEVTLDFNLTHEGMIIDRFLCDREIDRTYSNTYEEIYEQMHESEG